MPLSYPATAADWRLLARRRLPRFLFDYVDGGSSRDRLYGGGGRDTFAGQGGDDALFAIDAGTDEVYGGTGTDSAFVDSADIRGSLEHVAIV